jgi:adenosylcobinamide-GDP ribazoletransferase
MRSLFRALGFLSILPLGRVAHFEKQDIPAMLAAFPLAGAVLGALLGLFWHGVLQLWLGPATVLAIVAWVLLTRAFHIDGLADCADGLGGGYTRERRLAIMKDPHIGVFGTAAIVCILLLKTYALGTHLGIFHMQPRPMFVSDLPIWQRVISFALVLSSARFAILVGACGANYARAPEPGLGQDFVASARPWSVLIGAVVPVVLAVLLNTVQAYCVLAAVIATALILRFVFTRAIGGQTGDTLGATVELAEVAAMLALCTNYIERGI